jgi:hypothetical protein
LAASEGISAAHWETEGGWVITGAQIQMDLLLLCNWRVSGLLVILVREALFSFSRFHQANKVILGQVPWFHVQVLKNGI